MNDDQALEPRTPSAPTFWQTFRRRLFRLALFVLCCLLVGVGGVAGIDVYVGSAARGRIYSEPSTVPHRPVALVLGTSKYFQGRINLFYAERIRAAATLYHEGRVRGILVSGDHGHPSYNEPQTMKDDLVAEGVAAEFITMDHAGFRTLDSVVRAREVFGLNKFIIVSQKFHCERAIYLARAHGIDAIGCEARDGTGYLRNRVRLREVLARSKAWLDVNILDAKPKLLGPPEVVALR